MLLRRVFATLVLGCGLLAGGSGLSGCTKNDLTQGTQNQGSLCAQACNNYAVRCGVAATSSFSSSSSGTTMGCVDMCNHGMGSKSGSSKAEYTDLLHCVAAANSCLEIQNACSS